MFIFVRVSRFLIWAGGLSLGLLGLIASSFYLVLAPTLPDVDQLREIQLQTPLRIYTRDGKLISEFGEQRRSPVGYEQVPQDLINAFLAAEDSRFFEHHGVDIKGLSRATLELLSTGSIQSGGSTITMQVAKNYFLSQERTFSRKFNEILLALKIESELDKPEILELYFNKIYLGNRAYGIEAAANVYYGKTLSELTLAQKAMIAGLPKAPSKYNPLAAPVRATIRRNWILARMKELGMISSEAYESARSAPVSAKYYATQPEADAPYVAEMARVEALKLLGPEAYTGGYVVTTTILSDLQKRADISLRKGLVTYTKRHGFRGPVDHLTPQENGAEPDTLTERLGNIPFNELIAPAWIKSLSDDDGSATAVLADKSIVTIPFESMTWANRYIGPNEQGPAPAKVSDVINIGDIVYIEPGQQEGTALLSQKPAVQGALVSLKPETGAILALSGGFDFYMSKFNRATQARRQPGSNFKPFIYLAGLENGVTAASIFNDAPVVFDDAKLETAWRPENSSGRFYGPTRLRKALYLSRNLVSIRLLQQLGLSRTIDFLDAAGFSARRLPNDLSLALGSATFTPMEVATGYATLANGGFRHSAFLIDSILDSEGQPIPLQTRPEADLQLDPADQEAMRPDETEAPPIADPRSIYILTDILKDVIRRGTATDAKALQRSDLAGKTGTTNDQIDAWFSGYNRNIATTVWVGFDQPSTLGRREYGSRAALPVWIDYMQFALANQPEANLPRPDGILSVRIDPETGLRAKPGQQNGIFELFIEGTEPPVMSEQTEQIRSDTIEEDLYLPEDLF